MIRRDNVRVHRATASKLNSEKRAPRGSVCNALLSRARSSLRLAFSPDCSIQSVLCSSFNLDSVWHYVEHLLFEHRRPESIVNDFEVSV